jgi:L-alanine-DL-glutamate epimerase-like enolase superfamily enzyme
MQHYLFKHQLNFRFPFHIAHGIRKHTDIVYLKLQHEAYTAWGEAALPPYLSETQRSVVDFIYAFMHAHLGLEPEALLTELQQEQINMPARAALDMALHSLLSQMQRTTMAFHLNITQLKIPPSFYTIAACSSLHEMQERVQHGLKCGFSYFKLKLTDEDIAPTVEWFTSATSAPFAVDANQSWRSLQKAVSNSHFLKGHGCLLIEQPFPKNELALSAKFRLQSSLPVFADESCQRLSQLPAVAEAFDGVNIKLMKCGGLSEALQMIHSARAKGMQVLIGCMSESSIGCDAAAHLAPLCDYADLDGPFLITNDFNVQQWA